MGRIKELVIMNEELKMKFGTSRFITDNIQTILDHLDCLTQDQLELIHTAVGIEIMERDAEWQAQAEMAEAEARFRQIGELMVDRA